MLNPGYRVAPWLHVWREESLSFGAGRTLGEIYRDRHGYATGVNVDIRDITTRGLLIGILAGGVPENV